MSGNYTHETSGAASVEGVIARVGAALEQLPLVEVDGLVAAVSRAEVGMQAALADSTMPEAVVAVSALAAAAGTAQTARAALQTGITELTAYTGTLVGAGPSAGDGNAVHKAAMIGSRRRRTEVVPDAALCAAADAALEQLEPLASTHSTLRYVHVLRDQPDAVLCELLRRGMPLVEDVLVERHRGWLRIQARRLLAEREPRGLEDDDLIAAGIMDFLDACRYYIPATAKLLTYAGKHSWYAMVEALQEEGYLTRIPPHVTGPILGKIRRIEVERASRGEPRLTDREIADMFDMPLAPHDNRETTVYHVRMAGRLTNMMRSLQEEHEISPEGMPGFVDDLTAFDCPSVTGQEGSRGADEDYFVEALRQSIHRALHNLEKLDARAAAILRGRFGIGCEVRLEEDLAEAFGISRQRVNQIVKASLEKLAKRYPHLIAFLRS